MTKTGVQFSAGRWLTISLFEFLSAQLVNIFVHLSHPPTNLTRVLLLCSMHSTVCGDCGLLAT